MRRLVPKVLAALLLAVIVAVSRTSWAQTASLTGATPVAQTQDNAAAEYVRAGKLLDVRSGKVLSDQVIVIRGGRIERVANASEQQIPSGAHFVDLSRATVLPGLVDCHTHIMVLLPKKSSAGILPAVARGSRPRPRMRPGRLQVTIA